MNDLADKMIRGDCFFERFFRMYECAFAECGLHEKRNEDGFIKDSFGMFDKELRGDCFWKFKKYSLSRFNNCWRFSF